VCKDGAEKQINMGQKESFHIQNNSKISLFIRKIKNVGKDIKTIEAFLIKKVKDLFTTCCKKLRNTVY